MPNFTDDGEFDSPEPYEKRKNNEPKLKGCLGLVQPTPIIVALIALFGVIFTAVYQVPSGNSGQNQPLIIVIINALRDSDGSSQQTPTPNATATPIQPTAEVVTQVPTLTLTTANTLTPVTPFCAFLTATQIDSLRQIQDAAAAIQQAEEFAGFRQNDYRPRDLLSANVVIATNLYTTDFERVGVIPINNNQGYGLFLTTREIEAAYPGTYWCVTSTVLSTPTQAMTSETCNLTSPLTPLNSSEIIPDWYNSRARQLVINIPSGYDTLYISSDPAVFNGIRVDERLIILSQTDLTVDNLSFNTNDGHFNIWAIAFRGCTLDTIMSQYGRDGTNLVWLFDTLGRRSQYYP
jgi:hypothetical protein